jgi:Arc/MetJ family transcription regulator
MRTHIDLDDESLAQALALGGFTTRKEAVNAALAEYVKVLKRRQLLQVRGKLSWEGDLDSLRATRGASAS